MDDFNHPRETKQKVKSPTSVKIITEIKEWSKKI